MDTLNVFDQPADKEEARFKETRLNERVNREERYEGDTYWVEILEERDPEHGE